MTITAHLAGHEAFTNGETLQAKMWQGEFGRDYSDRNIFDIEQLNSLWCRNYGVSRAEVNRTFLEGVSKESKILEVGCNVGNQLALLRSQGYNDVAGVEIQPYALAKAQSRLPDAILRQGSALALPFEDQSFDLVFTAGVLIHVAPDDLPTAMREIHRCTRQYIWGSEYFSDQPETVNYRGHEQLLWKMNYAEKYLSLFPDMELVREQRLPYLEGQNMDSVFLLRKN